MSTLMLEIGISLLRVGTPEVAFPKERHCVRSTELDRSQCMTSLWEELCVLMTAKQLLFKHPRGTWGEG